MCKIRGRSCCSTVLLILSCLMLRSAAGLDTVYMSDLCNDDDPDNDEIFIDEGTGKIELMNMSSAWEGPGAGYPAEWSCRLVVKVRSVGEKRVELLLSDVSTYNSGRGVPGSPCDLGQDYLLIYRGNYDDREAELLTADGVCGVSEDGDWDSEQAYVTDRFMTLHFHSGPGPGPDTTAPGTYTGFSITYQAYTVREVVSYYDEQRLGGGIVSGMLFSLAFVTVLVDVIRTRLKVRSRRKGRAHSSANTDASDTMPRIKVTEHA